MYPVGDLIMGPQQLQALAGGGAGGAGGQRGGQGGGQGGGLGGGQGGGLGGGGMGGGMFSVPSEPLGAARNAVPNANPSEPAQKALRPRNTRTDRSAARLDSGAGTLFAQADESPTFTNDAVRASKKKHHVAR
jgi:hypothetical protein